MIKDTHQQATSTTCRDERVRHRLEGLIVLQSFDTEDVYIFLLLQFVYYVKCIWYNNNTIDTEFLHQAFRMQSLYIQGSFYSLGGRVEPLQVVAYGQNRSRHHTRHPKGSALPLSKKNTSSKVFFFISVIIFTVWIQIHTIKKIHWVKYSRLIHGDILSPVLTSIPS